MQKLSLKIAMSSSENVYIALLKRVEITSQAQK